MISDTLMARWLMAARCLMDQQRRWGVPSLSVGAVGLLALAGCSGNEPAGTPRTPIGTPGAAGSLAPPGGNAGPGMPGAGGFINIDDIPPADPGEDPPFIPPPPIVPMPDPPAPPPGQPVDPPGAAGMGAMGMAGLAGVPGLGGAGGTGQLPVMSCLAANVAVNRLDIYQTVGTRLVQNGMEVPKADRNADVVVGRKTILRVFVNPSAGFQPRELKARLSWTTTVGGMPMVKESKPRMVMGASKVSDPKSTLNFELMPEEVTADVRYFVELTEVACAGASMGDTSKARWPAAGDAELQARTLGGMKVVLVPIMYKADKSDRLPDLAPADVDEYRQAMLATYPIEALDMTVRMEVGYKSAVPATSGSAWSKLLNAVKNLRARDKVADDVFYYGMFSPAPTRKQYCGSGCIAGIAPLASPTAVTRRVGLGIGWKGSIDTFLHEIGHAMGRPHAPCGGAAGVDKNYPDQSGKLDAWGYDSRDSRLVHKDKTKDIMSYCRPKWFSAYTYRNLLKRLAFINSMPRLPAEQRVARRTIVVAGDGSVSWGAGTDYVHLLRPPTGWADILDARGRLVTQVPVHSTPIADLPGAAFVYVPLPEAGWHSIVLPGPQPLGFADYDDTPLLQ